MTSRKPPSPHLPSDAVPSIDSSVHLGSPAMSATAQSTTLSSAPQASASIPNLHLSPLQTQTPRRSSPAAINTDGALSSPRLGPGETTPSVRSWSSVQRSQRTQSGSFSGAALTELLMHPTAKPNGSDAKFRGRDWRTVQVVEIIDPDETRFVELDTSIEETTKLLIRSGAPNVALVRESRKTRTAIGTFDYSDLNAYLLMVLGLIQPDEAAYKIAEQARKGDSIPLHAILPHLGLREGPMVLPHTANLTQAMEVLGGGHHRVVICKEGTSEAVGVLSQLRLVRFFWDNHQNFAATESLFGMTLRELSLGTKHVLAINGEKPLSDALQLMHAEGITSLPVLDSRRNVVGNISHVDVRLLTDTSAIPLLSSSCIHFISIILSERGVTDGKDAYPVFHVTPISTLAHTVAKLCATRSHRMWIVDSPSPSTSSPQSPNPQPHAVPPKLNQNLSASTSSLPSTPARQNFGISSTEPASGTPYTSSHPSLSMTAGEYPGTSLSGRLNGVISLTDILNLFARASGLSPNDPEETRRRRRQSSSSTYRPSMESLRPSVDGGRPNLDVLRTPEHHRSPSASSFKGRLFR